MQAFNGAIPLTHGKNEGAGNRMNKQKIVVVEDDPLNMELVTDLLEVAGYTVIQAETAKDGIELAGSAKPVLILMDVRLPRHRRTDCHRNFEKSALTAHTCCGPDGLRHAGR